MRAGANLGTEMRGVSRSNPAPFKVRYANRMERKMKLQEVITKISDLDPEKDYNLTLTDDKLNIETAEKANQTEVENLKKEVEDLKKVNKSLLEKTTVERNESVEDIVANIVGLKKEE